MRSPANDNPLKVHRISGPMLAVLRSLHAGRPWDYGLSGMSARGGGSATLNALFHRGLVDEDDKLTELGRSIVDGLNSGEIE